ncbi:transcriptional regulator of the spore photoproduct lyase operon [Pullulanibacillus pueri]|uniref:Transcriptional regulator n=1 Tax=Pullulanibacillus pueri TaxID=1437324 RepID=A0A8J2ZSM4_9BACL|nr:transcriptional regulator SplA domain-containing protein [Pullulanibacillus pueri]MBM7680418.1 transcriptional regulator of the spore photoproduct lyase operon [Pullulanibacillus pueri]GGH75186.1 hypothetical protein GCM10007096_04140 [Pullulanibacillus pueri]
MNETHFQAGEAVYVKYHHPLSDSIANVQEATIVEDPDHPGELCLWIQDTYYPLSDEIAVYRTVAERGSTDQEDYSQSPPGEIF